jgi:hypothetical protein
MSPALVPATWHPLLTAMATAVMPFEHPAMPRIDPAELAGEARERFGLDEAAATSVFPRALVLFDDVAGFGVAPSPFLADERTFRARGRLARADVAAAVTAAAAADASAWRAYTARFSTTSFAESPLEARRAYLALWRSSDLATRRHFYRGAKAIVTITAYSRRDMWTVIGYDGPLVANHSDGAR